MDRNEIDVDIYAMYRVIGTLTQNQQKVILELLLAGQNKLEIGFQNVSRICQEVRERGECGDFATVEENAAYFKGLADASEEFLESYYGADHGKHLSIPETMLQELQGGGQKGPTQAMALQNLMKMVGAMGDLSGAVESMNGMEEKVGEIAERLAEVEKEKNELQQQMEDA